MRRCECLQPAHGQVRGASGVPSVLDHAALPAVSEDGGAGAMDELLRGALA